MKEIKLPSKTTEANVYDDDNIPEIDLPGKSGLKNVIPDKEPEPAHGGFSGQ